MQMDACFRPPDLVRLYKQSVELIFQLGATAEEEMMQLKELKW